MTRSTLTKMAELLRIVLINLIDVDRNEPEKKHTRAEKQRYWSRESGGEERHQCRRLPGHQNASARLPLPKGTGKLKKRPVRDSD